MYYLDLHTVLSQEKSAQFEKLAIQVFRLKSKLRVDTVCRIPKETKVSICNLKVWIWKHFWNQQLDRFDNENQFTK